MKKQSTFQPVIASIVLAIGIGVVWGFAAGGIGSFVYSLFAGQSRNDIENIIIDKHGRPLIETRIAGNYNNQQTRTLDGELVEEKVGGLAMATLQPAYRAPGLVENPISWNQRVAGITVAGNPPVSWFLVRDNNRPGGAYFEGYEQISNQLVGFLGREGLSTSSPPEDERFGMGDRVFDWGSNLFASVGHFNIGFIGYLSNDNLSGPGAFRSSQVFLCDGNTIREVDLRSREMRKIGDYDHLLGVAIVGVVLPGASDDSAQNENQPKTEHRLLLRCSDRLVLINTFDSTEVEFKLPAGLEDKSLTVSTSGPNRLLLQVNRGYWEQGSIIDLLTINPEGEIEQQNNVRLLGYVPDQSPSDSLAPAGIVPSFLPWCVGLIVVAPLVMLQSLKAASFSEGLGIAWDAAWPGFLVVLAVSVILAFIVTHMQKKNNRPNTGLWIAFVFLLGVPGLVVYWLHFRGSPVAKCISCGQQVPRDRDTCARCAEPFPEPVLRGTEIFA